MTIFSGNEGTGSLCHDMVRDNTKWAIGYSYSISIEGKILVDHLFAILEHFNQTKEYIEIGWLFLTALQ